jgi:hypothetical protein
MATIHEKMTALANAIREKTGSTNKLSLDGMIEEIGKIKGGFPNGTEWTQSNITNEAFISIYNANGIWVASSYNYYGLYYSTDGKNWTQSNIT